MKETKLKKNIQKSSLSTLRDTLPEKHLKQTAKEIINLQETKKSIVIQDPLKGLRKTINSLAHNDPFAGMRKTIEAITHNDPLRGVNKAIESIANNDPFKNLRKTMESIANNNQFQGISKAIESITQDDPFRNIRKTMESIARNDPFKEIIKTIESQAFSNSILELRKTIEKYHQATDVYKNIFAYSTPANTFEQAYKEVFSSYINELALSKNDQDEATLKVVEDINHKVTNFGLSKLSLEFYLNFVMSLFFLLYSLHLSEQSEARITDSIMQTQTVIIERLEKIESVKNNETYYIVDRAVNLRLKPSTKSTVLNTLHPNQKVRLVERKGKWIKVEYYSHLLGIHENGWCYKKYLFMSK